MYFPWNYVQSFEKPCGIYLAEFSKLGDWGQ
jgi:hypothetical protein